MGRRERNVLCTLLRAWFRPSDRYRTGVRPGDHGRGKDRGSFPAVPAAGIPALLEVIPGDLADDDILVHARGAGEPDHIPGACACDFWVFQSFSHGDSWYLAGSGRGNMIAPLRYCSGTKRVLWDMVWPARMREILTRTDPRFIKPFKIMYTVCAPGVSNDGSKYRVVPDRCVIRQGLRRSGDSRGFPW